MKVYNYKDFTGIFHEIQKQAKNVWLQHNLTFSVLKIYSQFWNSPTILPAGKKEVPFLLINL